MGTTAGFGISDALADAVLRCIARWGLTKTTLEDVAREARTSRATVYRTFPGGGKDALFAALAARELTRLEATVAAAVEAATDLEDALVAAVTSVAGHLGGHAAFQFLLAHEPGLVLPHLAFHHLDRLLARVRTVGGPLLERFLPSDAAAELAEWVARIIISYTCCPAIGVRLTDDASVRRLVRSYVLPAIAVPA
jgi:AcrR family transcriptional regulator